MSEALKTPQPPDYSKPPDDVDPAIANWLMKHREPLSVWERHLFDLFGKGPVRVVMKGRRGLQWTLIRDDKEGRRD